jgi:RNA polymerase sigma-70 factor (ECF subfamily)
MSSRTADLVVEFMRRRAQHLGFLRVLCRNQDLAEELFQDLTVAVLEGAGRFQADDGQFDAWVRGIARNLWRTHLRRRRPTTPLDGLVEEAVAAAWDERTPVEACEHEERFAKLQACLARLNANARELVRRRYEEAEDTATIAAALGRSVTAVNTALCRIRSTLLACLGWPLESRG